MYTALVIDDEEIIRRGIVRKLERFFPDIETAQAQENAIEALHYIQTHPVDIVFVDIRMPMLDGLEFIKRARQHCSTLQFVIVSGYTSFEYAKEAIHLGVKDYLLKPIDNQEFQGVVHRIIGELEQKESNLKNENQVKAQAEEGRFQKKNRYLTELIRVDSTMDTVELLKDLEGLDIHFLYSHFRTVVILVQNIRTVPEFEDVSGQYILQFAVCNIMNEIFMNCGCRIFAHEKKENQFIAILNTETSLASHFLLEKTKYLVEVLKNIYGMQVFAGIGGEVDCPEDICVSYTQAQESALQGLVLADQTVGIHQKRTGRSTKLQFLNEFEKNILEGYLKSQNQKGIAEFIQRLLEDCKKEGVGYANIRILCFDIYMLVVKMLQEKGLHAEWAMGMFDEMEEKIEKGANLRDVEKFLTDNLIEVSGQFDTHKKSSGKALIEEIREYVDSHYSKDISLGSIAGKFYINASYLSQLFKKEMNIKFIDYITKIRLEKAIELLKDTSLTVNEIAEAVGYKDARYFREIFVKHMGKTPSQYRKTGES